MSALPSDNNSDKTKRYARKRELILDVATDLINEMGVKGMTFVDVAQRVELNTTSITYYFKRKELLAEAVFERSIDRMEEAVLKAAKQPDPRSRVSAYLEHTLEEWARIRRREERPPARLSDLRAMDEPMRARLAQRYFGVYRDMRRRFFGAATTPEEKALRTARSAVLAENIFWLPAWLNAYSDRDFPRVHKRLFEVFDKGVAVDGAKWKPKLIALDEEPAEAEAGPETFLRAATRLINELGYRGASVERIASTLNVTKGSFYHHLEAKDDLVLQCFRRSYDRVSLAQHAAMEKGNDAWAWVSSSMASLLNVQLHGDFPLLRTTALQALPSDVRPAVLERSNRMARRFSGMLIDGITEGTIRPIDPLIAAQAIMATINTAYELREWARLMAPEKAIDFYASTMAYGLFDKPKL